VEGVVSTAVLDGVVVERVSVGVVVSTASRGTESSWVATLVAELPPEAHAAPNTRAMAHRNNTSVR